MWGNVAARLFLIPSGHISYSLFFGNPCAGIRQ
jgi:hypothetical protein